MIIMVLDDIIRKPEKYVEDILRGDFVDMDYGGDYVFKGIQKRERDEFQCFIENIFPEDKVVYNFVRQSPINQNEPNHIHSDEMMGDKTVLLYLNKSFPEGAGTTIYNKDLTKSYTTYMKYNRVFIFDSHHKHSRNIIENFGEGDSSRLVQVIFLKSK